MKEIFLDGLFVAGLGSIGYGIWMLSHPAALIYAGIAASTLAYFLGAGTQEADGPAE